MFCLRDLEALNAYQTPVLEQMVEASPHPQLLSSGYLVYHKMNRVS